LQISNRDGEKEEKLQTAALNTAFKITKKINLRLHLFYT